MDKGEIEELYNADLKSIEEWFIDSLKSGVKLGVLEVEYKKKCDSARSKFEKNIKKVYLNSPNKKVKKFEISSSKTKPFRAKILNMETSFFSRVKYFFIIFKFKTIIRLKNVFGFFYYPSPSYYVKKTSLKSKRSSKRVLKGFRFVLYSIAHFFVVISLFVFSRVKWLVSKSWGLIKLLFSKLGRKKKGSKKGDGKKEDSEKLGDKGKDLVKKG